MGRAHSQTTSVMAILIVVGCQSTPVTTTEITPAKPVLPEVADDQLLAFEGLGQTRAEALDAARKKARGYLYNELERIAEQESLYCQSHFDFSSRGLFFGQQSLAPSEIWRGFAADTYMAYEDSAGDQYTVTISFPQELPRKLVRHYMINLQGYVVPADRTRFCNRYRKGQQ